MDTEYQKGIAREAFKLSHELQNDLLTAMQIYRTLRLLPGLDTEAVQVGFRRVVLFSIIGSLAKYMEFYQAYKAVLPHDVRGYAKTLLQECRSRGVREFRNQIAWHIKDKATGKPLTADEVERRLGEVIKTDVDSFLLWINDPEETENQKGTTAVGIIEAIRVGLQREYGFANEDLG